MLAEPDALPLALPDALSEADADALALIDALPEDDGLALALALAELLSDDEGDRLGLALDDGEGLGVPVISNAHPLGSQSATGPNADHCGRI